MDDPKNAKQAYEHSLSLDGENVYTNLNYAVFLYNQGDRQAAATRLVTFRKIFDAIIQGKRREIDPELQEISSKLGPVLNVGELVKPPQAANPHETTPTSAKKKQQQQLAVVDQFASAAKYANISQAVNETGDAYRRESTMASVSRIGIHGDSAANLRSESAAAATRPTTSELVRKSFGAEELDKS